MSLRPCAYLCVFVACVVVHVSLTVPPCVLVPVLLVLCPFLCALVSPCVFASLYLCVFVACDFVRVSLCPCASVYLPHVSLCIHVSGPFASLYRPTLASCTCILVLLCHVILCVLVRFCVLVSSVVPRCLCVFVCVSVERQA